MNRLQECEAASCSRPGFRSGRRAILKTGRALVTMSVCGLIQALLAFTGIPLTIGIQQRRNELDEFQRTHGDAIQDD